jgi:hypothetical protein
VKQQNLILNILTFTHPTPNVECSFQLEKADGFYPVKVNCLPVNITEIFSKEQLENVEYAYTNFTANENISKPISVELAKSQRFSKNYYTWRLYNYFINIADAIKTNFVNDISLWFMEHTKAHTEYSTYQVYSLKVQIAKATKEPELVVSYDGTSRVSKKSVEELTCDNGLFSSFLYEKRIYHKDDLPTEAGYHLEKQFPKINFHLSKALGLQTKPSKPDNKYKDYYNIIIAFYKKYLGSQDFKEIIVPNPKGFTQIETDNVKQTTFNSNQLQFGQEHKDLVPYNGMKAGGPFDLSPHKNIKFLFIYHTTDKENANTIIEWFDGKKYGFRGLKNFVKLNYSIDTDKEIVFTNSDNPLDEIKEKLAIYNFPNDVKFVAVYLSQIPSDEKDEQKHKIYYQVKEELLNYRITSQVIDINKIGKDGYNFYLPNIAIALLAKLNGIPWRLERDNSKALIVGVGAFKSLEINERFIGSAFCFSNDGRFKGFECHPATDTYLLAGDIAKAVRKFQMDNAEIPRLIIHFYKSMGRKELEPIEKELDNLNLDIPIIIVTINKTESKDFVVFDTNSKDIMPISGTYIKTGWNEYLLCNNTRYGNSVNEKVEAYPFPIKIKLKATDETIFDDQKVIRALIDQVYQFSRMYWKSVKQQNLPVTILYPEMVAEMVPHFDDPTMPPFGKENLWFLSKI